MVEVIPQSSTLVRETPLSNASARKQALYKLSSPVSYDWDYDQEKNTKETEYVWVSSITDPFSGPETYIFPCDETGDVLDWCELNGSYRGGFDHEQALRDMGFPLFRLDEANQ